MVERLRLALSDDHPVVLSFKYYADDPFIVDTDGQRYTLVPLNEPHEEPDKPRGGHAVFALGYDKDNVICQTSWGPDYGPDGGIKDGLFRMPWNYISDFEATTDFWVIKTFRPGNDVDGEDEKDKQAKDENDKAAADEKARKAAQVDGGSDK